MSHTVSESSCPSLGPEMSTLVTRYSGLGGTGQEGGAQGFEGWAGSWVESYESLNLSCSPGSRPWSSRRGNPGVWEIGESKKGQVMCQRGRGTASRRGISGVSCPVQAKNPLRLHPEVSCAIISLSHPPNSAGLCLGCGLPASEQALQVMLTPTPQSWEKARPVCVGVGLLRSGFVQLCVCGAFVDC